MTENQKAVLRVFARTASATKKQISRSAGVRHWFPAASSVMAELE